MSGTQGEALVAEHAHIISDSRSEDVHIGDFAGKLGPGRLRRIVVQTLQSQPQIQVPGGSRDTLPMLIVGPAAVKKKMG